ncbi:antitoxin ParD1/3/4 [Cyclobacterium xiamenense]|jgi:antitoxin ParD1/3/4|uniref:Antitoxin ParD1/3/4 n=2 Tax=Cyclobacteriaceae TaxID=563798 RepID=A0A1H6ZRC8_9BACT|nr:antitoxin ParD1/3/4 [Cyclobacterium xiamenense]
MVYFYTKIDVMARQTITVNEPNDRWMKEKIQDNEYASKSELINDLIRRQREHEEQRNWLRAELIKGEESGYSSKSMSEVLEEAKKRAKNRQ